MGFVTDKQTLDDLNILGRYKSKSIFSLFNHTITDGGGRLLEKMFQEPLCSADEIIKRNELFSFFEKVNVLLPFTAEEFSVAENYLHNSDYKGRLSALFNISKSKVLNALAAEQDYIVLQDGLAKTIEVLLKVKDFMDRITTASQNTVYYHRAKRIQDLLNSRHMESAWQYAGGEPLSFKQVIQLDYLFKGLLSVQMADLLLEMYEIDVCITVAGISKKKGFTYAKVYARDEKFIEIKGVYHPSVSNAIPNDVSIGKGKNVFFLTGANMAGKSTFMKSFAIATYLAHMGFPVAAREMSFSLHDGIYSSINVPDNLMLGYSHFYAEVLRVKKVAEEVASEKQLLILFDELFKGTNVKDAYDGTVAIIDAFSKRNGTFIISTHIMEAGETLRKNNKNLFFRYLPTIMNGNVPTYPYVLEDGITDDRHGMIIIQNEGILEIINNGDSNKSI